MPPIGLVRLREAVQGVGGILGRRVSERRGRWYAPFRLDRGWHDGESSEKAEPMPRAKDMQQTSRRSAFAQTEHEAARECRSSRWPYRVVVPYGSDLTVERNGRRGRHAARRHAAARRYGLARPPVAWRSGES